MERITNQQCLTPEDGQKLPLMHVLCVMKLVVFTVKFFYWYTELYSFADIGFIYVRQFDFAHFVKYWLIVRVFVQK